LESTTQNTAFLTVQAAKLCHKIAQDFWSLGRFWVMRGPVGDPIFLCTVRGTASMGRGQSYSSISPSCQPQAAKPIKWHLQASSSEPAFPPSLGTAQLWPLLCGYELWAQASLNPKPLQGEGYTFAKCLCSAWAILASMGKVWILLPMFPLWGCPLRSWHSPRGPGRSPCEGAHTCLVHGVTSAPKWNALFDCGLTHNIYAILCFTLGEYAVILANYTICQE